VATNDFADNHACVPENISFFSEKYEGQNAMFDPKVNFREGGNLTASLHGSRTPCSIE